MSCGLRDVMEFEMLGKPAVRIASSAFLEAATSQAVRFGQPAIRRVFVPHPVQDRTDRELRAMAVEALDKVLRSLSS